MLLWSIIFGSGLVRCGRGFVKGGTLEEGERGWLRVPIPKCKEL